MRIHLLAPHQRSIQNSPLLAIYEQNPNFGPSFFFSLLHFEMEPSSLLQRYRHDRRKLLDFILSSGLIKEIRTSSSGSTTSVSNINFDVLSADYVLHCIQSGKHPLSLSVSPPFFCREKTQEIICFDSEEIQLSRNIIEFLKLV